MHQLKIDNLKRLFPERSSEFFASHSRPQSPLFLGHVVLKREALATGSLQIKGTVTRFCACAAS